MVLGDAGEESYRYLPDLPVYFRTNPVEEQRTRYVPATALDPTKKPPTLLRLSRSGVDLFLQSPRTFWMKWVHGFSESIDSPPMTLNTSTGTLLEGACDAARAASPTATLPFLIGTPLESMRPWVHPTDPDFVQRICGRPGGWRLSQETALPYVKSGESSPAFQIYGELDEIFVTTNEDGDEELVIVDFKSKSKAFGTYARGERAGQPKIDSLLKFKEFGYWYRLQADFYHWHLRRALDASGITTPIHPVAYFVYVNLDPSNQNNLVADPAGGRVSFGFDVHVASHTVDDAWVEPTLDLMVDCLRMTSPPAEQYSASPTGKATAHHEWGYGKRYHWLWQNFPSTRNY